VKQKHHQKNSISQLFLQKHLSTRALAFQLHGSLHFLQLLLHGLTLRQVKWTSYGGLQEQYDRIYSIKDQLEDYIVEAKGDKAIFLDAGDGVEGFENTGSQAFTNSLSLMDQIDLEATYEQSYIQLLAEFHNTVEVYGIDSNHAKWRSGKAVLGRPGDDWGRFIKRQLRKAFALNPEQYGHVTFDEPDMWDRTLNVDVYGTGIGLAHGDQVSSIDAIPKWWAGQSHGSQATADSEILITGHFHHFLLWTTVVLGLKDSLVNLVTQASLFSR